MSARAFLRTRLAGWELITPLEIVPLPEQDAIGRSAGAARAVTTDRRIVRLGDKIGHGRGSLHADRPLMPRLATS